MRILNIHSRKGGVGKTSIALSTSVQLAAKGYKTALLDLDMMGTHLVNSLPLRPHVSWADGSYWIRTDNDRRSEPGPDSKGTPFGRDTVFWNKILIGLHTQDKLRDTTEALMTLCLPDDLQRSSPATAKMISNLHLMPGSCFIRDIDAASHYVYNRQGQDRFKRFLSRTAKDLAEQGFDYLVLDNSPGLSLSPGLNLDWTLSIPESKNEWECHCWFICGSAPWEPGLVYYEMLGMPQHQLQRLKSLVLIVNEVGTTYRGLEEGGIYDVGLGDRHGHLVEAISSIPIWQYAPVREKDFVRKYVKPIPAKVALLGSDIGITDSVREREADHGLWSDWSEKYVRGFIEPAVNSESKFHKQIRHLISETLN